MSKIKDMTGLRFGRLFILHRVPYIGKSVHTRWKAICDCGNETIVQGTNLRSGHTQSCGCSQKEMMQRTRTKHGMSSTGTYRSWSGLKERCTNLNIQRHDHDYMGKGITYCERWEIFENFLEDMGVCPEGMSIDRKDNNGNYEPSNCRWATQGQQQNNKSNNHYLNHDGVIKTCAEWDKIKGHRLSTVKQRISRGWSISESIELPSKKRKDNI